MSLAAQLRELANTDPSPTQYPGWPGMWHSGRFEGRRYVCCIVEDYDCINLWRAFLKERHGGYFRCANYKFSTWWSRVVFHSFHEAVIATVQRRRLLLEFCDWLENEYAKANS